MTKLVLAAIAALSILASPVLAGPADTSTATSEQRRLPAAGPLRHHAPASPRWMSEAAGDAGRFHFGAQALLARRSTDGRRPPAPLCRCVRSFRHGCAMDPAARVAGAPGGARGCAGLDRDPGSPGGVLAAGERADRVVGRGRPHGAARAPQHERHGWAHRLRHRRDDRDANFADIAYEFAVAGKTFRGSRIDLGVDFRNVDVAQRLRRYPPGAVVTVFYDPRDPAQCILERDDPKNLHAAWLGVAVLAGLIVAGVLGIDRLADVVRHTIADPALAPLVMALGLFAVVVALFAHMVGRKAHEMRSWTKTEGRIVQSAVERTVRTHDRPSSLQGRTVETIFVPRIVYRYSAGGNSFDGDDIGGAWSSSAPATAETYVARFPVNATVAVWFNPRNPTKSTLGPGAGTTRIVLWAIAVLLAAAALAAAKVAPGVFTH